MDKKCRYCKHGKFLATKWEWMHINKWGITISGLCKYYPITLKKDMDDVCGKFKWHKELQ